MVSSRQRLGEMDPQWMRQARLPNQRLLQFTRHPAVLFASGVPLLRCLEVIEQQADHPVLAEMTWSLSKDVQSGRRLSAAFDRFPGIFAPTFVAVIRLAELTGQLHLSLARLADWQERDARQRSQLKAALIYPAFVLALTLVMSLWMCYAILPGILEGLRNTSELPWPTLFLMHFVSAIRRPLGILFLLALLGSSLGGGVRLLRNPPQGWEGWVWRRLLKWPVVGPAMRDCALVRYCAAAQILVGGGSDLLRTLTIAAAASGNPCLVDDQSRLRRAVEQAEPLGLSMAKARWLTA